jgi:hypothetical protein
MYKFYKSTLYVLSILLIASCGGGKSTSNSPDSNPTPSLNAVPSAQIVPLNNLLGLHLIELDGSLSSDSDGTINSYQWEQTQGEVVELSSDIGAKVSFVAPNKELQLQFKLTVTDNLGATSESTITVLIKPYFLKVDSSFEEQKCALTVDSVFCWGGFNLAEYPTLSNPLELAVGDRFVCVIDDNGVSCFGEEGKDVYSTPATTNPRNLVAGENFACVIDDNIVKCWGEIEGNSDIQNPTVLDASYNHACAINDTDLDCWGSPFSGILNTPDVDSPTHLVIEPLGNGNCVIDNNQSVCWGNNGQTRLENSDIPFTISKFKMSQYLACASGEGQFNCWGSGATAAVEELAEVNLANVEDFIVTQAHVCTFNADAGLQCFGYTLGDTPELANPHSFTNNRLSNCVIDDTGVVCWGGLYYGQTEPNGNLFDSVATGYLYTCGIADNEVSCWGDLRQRQEEIPQLVNPTIIEVNESYTCSIDENGANCWGPDVKPRANVINGIDYQEFAQQFTNPLSLASGYERLCVIENNKVECIGQNFFNDLVVPELISPEFIAAGDTFTCVIDNGSVVCWGSDDENNQINTPVLSNVTYLSAEAGHACAIADQEVYCWGRNNKGQTDVTTNLINPKIVEAGFEHSCAIDDTGVKCWGDNTYGQLDVPEDIVEPEILALLYGATCAGNDSYFTCWGWLGYGQNKLPLDFNR